MEPSKEAKHIAKAVVRAARHLVAASLSSAPISVSRKSDNTIVLNLDLESDAILRESLGEIHPILSEEQPESHGLIGKTTRYFVVDPLDGTSSCRRFLTARGGQVGFGPLVGYVEDGRLLAASFYNIPSRTLYVAERGYGAFSFYLESLEALERFNSLEGGAPLTTHPCVDLGKAAVIFFAGTKGETRIVEQLKKSSLIENVYRFGGFANDCTRLSHGYEQIQIQFSVKPWDLSAALIAELSGVTVIVDPLNRAVPLSDWKIEMENPIIAGSQELVAKIIEIGKNSSFN